ncbi:uncharacterized [Tachysurus ichikawai]
MTGDGLEIAWESLLTAAIQRSCSNQSLVSAQPKGVLKATIGAEAFHGVRGSRCPGKGALTPSHIAVKEK